MTTQELIAVPQPQTLDPDAIIRELDAAFDYLPETALRACQQHRDVMAPRLVAVLEEAARLGREGIVREGNAHLFALFLVTEFREQAAFPAILEIYSFHDPLLEDLTVATEVPRRVLAVFAGDQPELIESLISSRQLDDYIRWEAAAALCSLVFDGRMTREDAVERLMRQVRAAVAVEDAWAVTICVCELSQINPLETKDEIKSVFDTHLVDESIINWRCFERHLHPEAPDVCPALEYHEPSAIADTVEELRGWYCFSEECREADKRAEVRRLNEPVPEAFSPLDSWEPPPPSIGTIRQDAPRVGRNDPCPCGSGKKYKKCCLRTAGEEL